MRIETWSTFNRKRGAFRNRSQSRYTVLQKYGFDCIWAMDQMPLDFDGTRKEYVKSILGSRQFEHVVYYAYVGRISNVEIEIWAKPINQEIE